MDEQRLRALASAASVGPWSVQGNNLDEWYVYALHARYETLPGNPSPVKVAWVPWSPGTLRHEHDAAYIAAASPDAILRLLDALDAARAERDAALARAIPPGCVVVPAEPTKAMIERALLHDPSFTEYHALQVYYAMIDAAPPPAAPQPLSGDSDSTARLNHTEHQADRKGVEPGVAHADASLIAGPRRQERADASPRKSADPARDENRGTVAEGCGRAAEPATAPQPAAPEPSEAARMYIDGEWNSYRGDLLSLALVGEDGCEWYEVLEFDGKPDPWVAANVMPKLRKAPVSLELMQGSLQRFLDRYPAGVHIVADWPEDIERFCRVLVTGPGQRLGTPPLTMEVVRIEPVSADPHNALADARALRDALRAAAAARGD